MSELTDWLAAQRAIVAPNYPLMVLEERVQELLAAHDAATREQAQQNERRALLAALNILASPTWGASVGACAEDYPELPPLIAGIREQAKREQMDALYAAACDLCANPDPYHELIPRPDSIGWLHNGGAPCGASPIRSAWAKAHPEEAR